MRSHGAYIRGETLTTEAISGHAPEDAHVAPHDLEGASVTLGVRRNG